MQLAHGKFIANLALLYSGGRQDNKACRETPSHSQETVAQMNQKAAAAHFCSGEGGAATTWKRRRLRADVAAALAQTAGQGRVHASLDAGYAHVYCTSPGQE